jgi:hydrogenase 3 maturation protease
MSYNNSWEDSLKQTLTRLKQKRETPRLVILGIGNELNGDDGAGPIIAQRLAAIGPLAKHDDILILNGGQAPESMTGPIRRFSPDLILFVDIALMAQEPGAICWLSWEETAGLSASSHTLPPYVLAQYLTEQLGCEIGLLGIQPADTSLDASLSPPVSQAADDICRALARLLP